MDFFGGDVIPDPLPAESVHDCRLLCIHNFMCELFTWDPVEKSCGLKANGPEANGRPPWYWKSYESKSLVTVSGSAFCPYDEDREYSLKK